MSRVRSNNSTSVRPLKTIVMQGGGSYDGIKNTYNNQSPLTPNTVYNSSYIIGNSSSMIDVVSPGYYKAVNSGGVLPVNPMSQTRQYYGSPVTTFSKWFARTGMSTGYFAAETLEIGLAPPVLPTDGYSGKNDLVLEAVSNARSKCFDASTFLAEFGSTVSMFLSAKRNLLRMARRIADDDRRRAINGITLSAAETWLTYRYGILPLLSDLRKIEEKMGQIGSKYYPRGYAEYTSNSTSVTGWQSLHTGRSYGIEIKVTTVTQNTYRAMAMFECDGPGMQFDPVVTAWEVVPFSFVVDWFFNIGSNLAAFSPFINGTICAASVTTERTCVSNISEIRLVTTYTPELKVVPAVPNVVASTYSKTREKFTPSASVGFYPQLNVNRILDGLSLARVLLGSF